MYSLRSNFEELLVAPSKAKTNGSLGENGAGHTVKLEKDGKGHRF